MYKNLYDDAGFIVNAACYADKLPSEQRKAIVIEARRLLDKAGRRERITDKEMKWAKEQRRVIADNM